MNAEAAVDGIVGLFERLTIEDVRRLDAFYTLDARFKDPFNEVRGVAEIQRIFAHMFEALEAPRFVITSRLVQGNGCFLAWEFRFRFRGYQKGRDQVVRGASHLELADDGRIAMHRDYWDAAEEVYEKLPVVGGLMRWLKRRGAS